MFGPCRILWIVWEAYCRAVHDYFFRHAFLYGTTELSIGGSRYIPWPKDEAFLCATSPYPFDFVGTVFLMGRSQIIDVMTEILKTWVWVGIILGLYYTLKP